MAESGLIRTETIRNATYSVSYTHLWPVSAFLMKSMTIFRKSMYYHSVSERTRRTFYHQLRPVARLILCPHRNLTDFFSGRHRKTPDSILVLRLRRMAVQIKFCPFQQKIIGNPKDCPAGNPPVYLSFIRPQRQDNRRRTCLLYTSSPSSYS